MLGSLIRGFVFAKLWGWFCVPLGLPVLHVVLAIGLSLLISYAVMGPLDYAKEEDAAKAKVNLVSALITPWLILLLGYVIHLFL